MYVNPVHSNALFPIILTFSGSSILFNTLHSLNVLFLISLSSDPSSNVTFFNIEQLSKLFSYNISTLFGIIISSKFEH